MSFSYNTYPAEYHADITVRQLLTFFNCVTVINKSIVLG